MPFGYHSGDNSATLVPSSRHVVGSDSSAVQVDAGVLGNTPGAAQVAELKSGRITARTPAESVGASADVAPWWPARGARGSALLPEVVAADRFGLLR